MVCRSAEYEAGYNDSTKLFVQHLRDIGLDAEEQIVGLAEFFEPKALEAANSVTFSSGPLPLPVIYGRIAAYPSLVLPDDAFDSALQKAMAATKEADRRAAWAEVQEVMADRGNTVVWGLADTCPHRVCAQLAGTVGEGCTRSPGSHEHPYGSGRLPMSWTTARLIMILAMTVQNPDKTLSRKQRLQEKQRRQLAVVDTVDKAEGKVRKAEVELALAVTEAVQVFGSEQSASEGLDMPVEAIRRFLGMARGEADSADNVAEAADNS
ncbi:hypothetical protein [Streptomyces tailanensis]|uniref:hypothetical protein n=1 Tax=Streptomyces tailanensis TaxID=2569858 RepID=UPI001FE7AA71|nr:hypothetical protein [Streptomyces tailanensis]